MNPELVRLIGVFNKYKINYWLDSGTLLGVIRDKDIAKGDDDIDFSIWVEDVPKLKPIIKELSGDYRVQGGLKYIPESTILYHKKIKGLHLSIHYHHRDNSRAYCFMRAIRPKNIKKGTLRWVMWVIPHIIYNMFGKRKDTLNPSIHPLGKINFFVGERLMLRAPLNLLKETVIKNLDGKVKARVPKNYKKYLNFCYGNWHIPNNKWNPINDGRVIRIKDWNYAKIKKISEKDSEKLFEMGKKHLIETTTAKDLE